MTSLVCEFLNMTQIKLSMKQKRITGVENRLMIDKGEE